MVEESTSDSVRETKPNVGASKDATIDGMMRPNYENDDPFAGLADELVSEPEDDFDFGFQNAAAENVEKSSVNTREVELEESSDGFDFDLGFENPAAAATPNTRATNANASARTTRPKPDETRDRDYTPLAQLSAIAKHDIDDEFFALAESLASESSDSSYRGEPVLPEGEVGQTHNRLHGSFTHEEITGLHEASSEVSLVDDGGGRPGTNMSAILLEARRLYDAGEFDAALDITKKVLSRAEDSEAVGLRKVIEGEMERQHLSTIGSLSKTPQIAVSPSEIPNLDLDHRAGFMLSQIDGMMTFEDLVELSSMPRVETLEVLANLLDNGVIAS